MRIEKIPTQDTITREPFPASKKIYVPGKIHDIKVAMREISLSDTKSNFSSQKPEVNPSVTVYDTS
ncbi:MAG TPA: phosphomethylpyrimidine synthase ThiC, partial [Cytophagaceae bacterium]